MSPEYASKLQQALLDIGHEVEKCKIPPTFYDLECAFSDFKKSIINNSKDQKKNIDILLSELVKWEIQNL